MDSAGDEPDVITVAPPWTRSVLHVCSSLLVAGILFCVFGKVEHTGVARGIVRFAGGSNTLASQATGVVAEVKVAPGDMIEAGQPLVTLDSAAGRSALLAAERAVARAEALHRAFERDEKKLYALEKSQLERRVAILAARSRSHGASASRLHGKEAAYERLENAGLASAIEHGNIREELAASDRERLRVEDEIAQTEIAITGLSRELEATELRLTTQLQEAIDHRDAVALGLAESAILAPRRGRVDSVVVKSGDTVTVGTAIARVLPADAPLQVVAFAHETDRGFLVPGMAARVELDQFPPSEFGWVIAKVTRVGGDLVSRAEVRSAFGDFASEEPAGALHSVELEIVEAQTPPVLRAKISAGAMVNARYVLRRERIVFVLSEPLRRVWE